MSDQPVQCERCGQPHTGQKKTSAPGCRGHRRDQAPCGNDAMRGQAVCRMHGGTSRGARERAEERLAEQAADTTVRKLWPGLANVEPVKDPLELLARLTAAIEHAVDVAGERVNELEGKVAAGSDLSRLRGEVLLWERMLARAVQAGSEMAKLNIFEKQAALRDRDGDLVVAAFSAAIEAVPDLSSVQAQVLLGVFLTGVGRPQETVAGELEGPAAS